MKNEMSCFRKHSRKIALTLCCLLSVSMLATGCGKNQTAVKNDADSSYVMDENLNPPGEFPICKEPVTLRYMIAQHANVADYKENSYTKKLEEYGNVNMEFDVVPAADIQTKINLMMNSGGSDIPDVIISGLTPASCSAYGTSGMLVPLNQYYEHSSYYIKEALERTKEKNLLKYLTSADGNIYTVISYNETLQNEFVRLPWIYKPWLDEVGLDVPVTLEEYRDALMAFVGKDLNHNGVQDEIPLMDDSYKYGVWTILQAFIPFEVGADNLNLSANGKLRFAYTTEEWKEGVKYLRDLCVNGAFSPISFTSDRAQLKTMLAAEENKVGSFVWASPSLVPASSPRRADFAAVTLTGRGKNMGVWYTPSIPSVYYAITANCENPEAAFRIGDLMCKEEMTIWGHWGEKGVDWLEPSENDHSLFESLGYQPTIKPLLDTQSIQSSNWGIDLGFRTYEVAAGIVADDDVARKVKAETVEKLIDYIPKKTIGRLNFTQEELDTYNEIVVTAQNYMEEQITKFITGYEDVEEQWDSYLAELENIGLSEALAIAQAAYDRDNR